MDVVAPDPKLLCIPNAMICEAPLPGRSLRSEPVGRAALDQSHDAFDSLALRGKQKRNVIGHDNECMQLVVALMPILL